MKIKVTLLSALLLLTIGTLNAAKVIVRVCNISDQPVEWVSILIYPGQHSGVTGQRGEADFTLSAGLYSLTAAHPDYIQHHATIAIASDTIITICLTEQGIQLDEVKVVADSYTGSYKRDPLKVTAVKNDYLRESGSYSLMTKLNKLAGINSIDIGQGFAKPVIRGLTANRVAVAENGIKQQGQQWGLDHGLEIDPYNAEKVEVVKGPSSLEYGSDAIGGVILISPQKKSEDGLESTVIVNGNSNSKLLGGSGNLNYQKNGWFAKGRLTLQRYGDYYVPADSFRYLGYNLPLYDGRLKNTAGREQNVFLTTGVEKSKLSSSLSFSNVYGKMGFFAGAHGIPNSNSLLPDDNDRNIGLPYQQVKHLKLISNSKLVLAESQVLFFDAGYQRNHRQEYALPHQHGDSPLPATTLELDLVLQTLSATAKWEGTLSRQLRLTGGVNAELQNNNIGGYSFLLPKFNQQVIGGFAIATYTPHTDLTVTSGIRFDYGALDISGHTDSYIVDNFIRSQAIKQSYQNVSFSVGAAYNPQPALGFKFNVGKSFRMPTPNELASNGVHHGTFRYEIGDPTLKPEVAYQIDLSALLRNQLLSFSLSGFTSLFSNYIYLNPTGEYSVSTPSGELILLPDVGQVYRYTGGRSIRWGGEAVLDVYIARWLTASSQSEYVYARDTEHGYPIPFTPPFGMYNSLTFSMGSIGKLLNTAKLAIGHRYAAAQNRVRNEQPTPSYNLLEAMLKVTAKAKEDGHAVELVLAVTNLLNTKYFNHISFYRPLGLPEIGRNVTVSILVPIK